MKRILIAGFMAILLAAAPAAASLLTYDFTFAGNGASATGSITFDMALLTNPGRNVFDTSVGLVYTTGEHPYGTNSPGLVTALSVTVSGASVGNGPFTLADFDGVLFDTSTAGLNLNPNQQLVGQSVVTGYGTGVWGTPVNIDGSNPVQSWTGDFQLFSPAISPAPYGSNPFEITTAGGEAMQLTSFEAVAAVPEPATWLLISLGLGGLTLLRRRKA